MLLFFPFFFILQSKPPVFDALNLLLYTLFIVVSVELFDFPYFRVDDKWICKIYGD